jgi:hypothetical protein
MCLVYSSMYHQSRRNIVNIGFWCYSNFELKSYQKLRGTCKPDKRYTQLQTQNKLTDVRL